jgi:hypothetical protein
MPWRAEGVAVAEVAAGAAAVGAAAGIVAAVEAGEDTVAAVIAAEDITTRHPCRGRRVARRRPLDQFTSPVLGQAMAIYRRPAVGPRREPVPPPVHVPLRGHAPQLARDREHYLLAEVRHLAAT